MTKYEMGSKIMDCCEWIVKNCRLDRDGHMVVDIATPLKMLRSIVCPDVFSEKSNPFYTDTDSIKVKEDE